MTGRPYPGQLTPYQARTLEAYARAGTRKGAALALGVSQNTVEKSLNRAYIRLGVEGHIEAFRVLGWLRVPSESGWRRW